MKKNKIIFISSIILLIDQLIKYILVYNVAFSNSISIINNFFNITLIMNDGAAFSMFSGMQIGLIIISFALLAAIYLLFIKNQKLNKSDIIIFGILIGGILGNLIDRIVHNGVIDYLDFNIFNYNAPIFNFADICIVISMLILVLKEFGGNTNENK